MSHQTIPIVPIMVSITKFLHWNHCLVILLVLLKQARLWACGRGDVSTPSFGSHPNPISTRGGGGQIMPTLYWCPHQVLKATGAPA